MFARYATSKKHCLTSNGSKISFAMFLKKLKNIFCLMRTNYSNPLISGSNQENMKIIWLLYGEMKNNEFLTNKVCPNLGAKVMRTRKIRSNLTARQRQRHMTFAPCLLVKQKPFLFSFEALKQTSNYNVLQTAKWTLIVKVLLGISAWFLNAFLVSIVHSDDSSALFVYTYLSLTMYNTLYITCIWKK